MARRDSRGAAGGGALAGERILVAEDEAVIALDLEWELRDRGAEVVGPALTVAAALERIERDDPTAAILDLRLGSQSIAPVAGALASRGIPFVFYSGQVASDPEPAKWPLAPIVSKPATGGALIAVVAGLIREAAAGVAAAAP